MSSSTRLAFPLFVAWATASTLWTGSSLAASPYEGLRVELTRTSRESIPPGGEVTVKARLVNRGVTAVEVIRPGDGSEVGWREPWVRFSGQRTTPEGVNEAVPSALMARCGLYDPNWAKDVVRLVPGAAIELDTWIPTPSRALLLDRVGRVEIRMHYAFGRAPGKGHMGTPEETRAALAGVDPFEVTSNPITVVIESPLRLDVRLLGGASRLRVGQQTKLSWVFAAELVNVSDRPVIVTTPGTPTTLRLEHRPNGVLLGVDGPTPLPHRDEVTIAPGGRVPLLGAGARFSKLADGTWTPRDAGPIDITVVFDQRGPDSGGQRLVSAPLRVEVAPAR